jgi:hypothetical protein
MAVLAEIIGYSSCNSGPIENSEQAHPNQAEKNYCATPYAAFKVGLGVGGGFVRELHEEIIAVGTIVIAIFTIVLGLFTVNLAGATDKMVNVDQRIDTNQQRCGYWRAPA